MLETLLGSLGVVLLLGGCTLATIGLIGMILKPDLFEQLHASGLVTGAGTLLVLLASIGTGRAEIITSALLVAGFMLLTGSISTHVVANAGIRRYAPEPAEGIEALPRPAALATSGMRVVIGHDGSPAAQLAVELAAAIEWPPGSAIRVVFAADGEPHPDAAPIAHGEDGAPSHLDAAVARLSRPGLAVESELLRGATGDALVDYSAAFAADLLIIGRRRRGVVPSLLGLSAAADVVDQAPCPVLVARTPTLRSVMLTTDGSAQSGIATQLVAQWPIFDLTPVHVVNVAPVPNSGQASVVDATAAPLMDAGREVHTAVLAGATASRIIEAAEERGVDLVVIGSRGRTGLGRALLGSTASEVLASASCSVLIAKPPPHRFRRRA